MARRARSQGVEGRPENRVLSLWSPEKLYELCQRAAHVVCKAMGYPREEEDIAHDLWLHLHEHGHIVRYPKYEGAIVIFLKHHVRDVLRSRRKHDKSHDSINDADPVGCIFDLSDDNKNAEGMLEELAAEKLLERILHQARGTQLRISRDDRLQIIRSLVEDAAQADVAKSYGLEPWQVSRWLSTLRQRIK